jgi:hypothetical protein
MLGTTTYCLFVFFLFALGVALSRTSKFFILVLLTPLAWGAAGILASFSKLGLIEALVAVFLAGACLQIGYVTGALIARLLPTYFKREGTATQRRRFMNW